MRIIGLRHFPQWKVGAIHSHKFTYDMHTSLIRSRTLCIRYSYARIHYTYVTHTLVYATHKVINATMTDRRR